MGRKRRALATGVAEPSKAPETKPRRARGNRGKLEDLPNMPLDIIFEVMSYLLPMDLLNLSRTNKSFRRLLMVRSASPLWKAARKNVEGLPPCPQLLTEPAYANLVFDTHCNSCQKPGIKSIMWPYWVRYCPGCRKKNLIPCKDKDKCFFSEDCDDGLITYTTDITGKYCWHHLPEVSRLEKSIATMDDKAIAYRKKLVKESQELAIECNEWYEEAQSKRQQEIQDIRELRLQGIVSKLRELGWGDELDYMHPEYYMMRQHYNMKPVKELTERMWQNMRQDMIDFMERRRDWRLAREKDELQIIRGRKLLGLYTKWWRMQPDKVVLPRAVDIVCRPDMLALIRAPVEQEVDFEPFVERFPDWAQEWRKSCDDELRKIILNSPEFKGKILSGVDPLSLAVVTFTCTQCPAHLSSLYPHVLGHSCTHEIVRLHEDLGLEHEDLVTLSIVQDPIRSDLGFRPWSAKHFKLGVWHQQAVDIIELCGQDPETVTQEEMDALPARIWCEECESSMYDGKTREVFKWKDVFAHHAVHRRRNETNPASEESVARLKCMTGKIADDIMELEKRADAVSASGTHHNTDLYACSRCQHHISLYEDLADHMLELHGIETMEDEDSYRHPDGEIISGRPIYLIKSNLLAGADDPAVLAGISDAVLETLAGSRMFLYDL